ncbi:MAG: TonB-dependent receptor, partial [Flavobacteriales bacterium]|nr:TonB-dependent receptor [Flavobacteriales bacterium]
MKLIGIIAFSILVLMVGPSVAQTFTGHVKDALSREPVPFCTIYFVEMETGTTADGDGRFTIEHYPTERIHIQISSVGYKTYSQELDLGVESEMEFYLEESHVDLEEVVVSTSAGKLGSENVVSIDRKKLAMLQETGSSSLAEAIAEIPGVELNSTGTGIGKPVIRGLTGNRIVTYSQGIRVENQQWGSEHGLGVGDVGIESVEVIKGPASLLYGSDALGGVLYFVNERYAEHNTVQGYIRSKVLSNTLGNSNSVALKLHKGRMKLNLFGTYASHADYQQANGERVFNTRFDERNFKAALGYDLTNWISNLRYSYLENDFGIAEDTLFSTTDRSPVMPYQTIGNHSLSWENTLFANASKISLIGGYSGNRRMEFEDFSSKAALDMNLQTYSYNAKWYSPTFKDRMEVIAGAQGMFQTNHNRGLDVLVPDGSTTDIGVFSVINYSLDALSFQAGLRGDQRAIATDETISTGDTIGAFSASFNSVNYSAGAVFKGKHTAFRVNVSSGFRAPNTSELLSNGVHEGTNRYEVGNNGLQSEKATQFDFSIDYGGEHLNIQVNPFFNAIQNYIYLSPMDTIIEGAPAFQYLQTSAFLYGGEAGIHYHPHSIHWLHFENTLSTVMAEDKAGTPLPLIPSSKLSSTIKLAFSREKNLRVKELYVQHIYKFRQDRVG